MQDPRSNAASSVPIPAAAASESGAKGKLNRKKRKRRNHGKGGHARTGSKSSLKDIAIVANANASSSESEVASSNRQRSLDNDEDDVFEMEHDVEAEQHQPQQPFQQQPLQPSVSTPLLQPTSTPLRCRRASGDPLQMQQSGSAAMEQSSFLQSRLGHSTIESILDSQEKLKKESDELAARKKAHAQQQPPGAMDYFSEPELMSPQGSRPPSPVLSDTGRRTTDIPYIYIHFNDNPSMFSEYETRKRENSGGEKSSEQSWEWGKMPKSADHSGKDDTDGKDKVLYNK